MSYRELVKKVQHDSGFSDIESEQSLELLVESLAERFTDDELKDFASQLPVELKNLAMSTAMEPRDERRVDMVEEFMEKEMISEAHAKKQVLSAWSALRSFISEGQINHIKAQMPENTAALLY